MNYDYINNYSEDEFEDIQAHYDGKAEYDNGLIFLSSTTSIKHNEIKRNILTEFSIYLKSSKCKVYDEQIEVIFNDKDDIRKYKPDIFVMCGDASEKSESAMVKRFGSALECDVLKCGHHGSRTSTSEVFLKATNPTWAVISCGVDNSYGHPHQETLDRLNNDDVQVYRTDQLGTIIATSDGTNISWFSDKNQKR